VSVTTPNRHPAWLPNLLGMLIAVGPAATDMYLPAFPAVEASFGTAPGTAQLTLATWFVGLAIGQVSQGSMSDRFGRRRPLIAGCILFTICCVACALAPSMTFLAIIRLVAAFGASAGMVIARAIVRDLAHGQAAAIMMSRLILVMSLSPILAPTIGGALLTFTHWRVIFWLLSAYGLLCTLLSWKLLPETLPPDRRVHLSLPDLAARYVAIVREPTFITHALMGACGTFTLFAYLAGSAPVFEDGFGLSPPVFGAIFGLCASALVVSAQLNARLLPRFGLNRMLTSVAWLSFAATLVLCGLSFGGVHNLVLIALPLIVTIGCQGFSNANASAGALTRHAGHAGSAAALMGTLQYGLGAIAGLLVGVFTDGTPRGMAALMCTGMAGAVFFDRLRPHPERPHA
jgi:MFS transporter, DHA1 family, multidrug resistance protein